MGVLRISPEQQKEIDDAVEKFVCANFPQDIVIGWRYRMIQAGFNSAKAKLVAVMDTPEKLTRAQFKERMNEMELL